MKHIFSAIVLTFLYSCSAVAEGPWPPTQVAQDFANKMATEHDFDKQSVLDLLNQSEYRQDIIDAITRPAEGKQWHEYRPIFMKKSRVDGGIKFWEKHAATLAKAEREIGVPAEIIVAIIGVETRYGGFTGKHRVIDALTTLGFKYPPRSAFFLSELEHYLLMTREETLDPMALKGSYAGAMGMPQFISSSYRNYAIDFDGDGIRNLLTNPVDAIGSVANYFKAHGWKTGEAVASPVLVSEVPPAELLSKHGKPEMSAAEIAKKGVIIPHDLPTATQVALMHYDGKEGAEYWLAQNNFYVITRYNHSRLYALAVYQLSQAIRQARND